jgi:hypothetical protein
MRMTIFITRQDLTKEVLAGFSSLAPTRENLSPERNIIPLFMIASL